MMSKSKSPLSRGLRVLYVIPLVCLGLGLQARTVYVPDDKDNKNIFAGTEQDYEVNTDSLVFTIIAAPDTKMEEIDEIRNGLRRRGIQKIYYRLEGSESVIGDDAELLRKGKDFLRSRGADAQFLLRCDLGTSYGAYLHLQSLLRQVYDEVRAETGRDYPVKIAEAAMKDSAGRN